MEEFSAHNENQNPDDAVLNEGSDNTIPTADDNDYNHEFVYENAERLTGMPYLNYLRLHDDMI